MLMLRESSTTTAIMFCCELSSATRIAGCHSKNRTRATNRSEEHTSELQSRLHLVCRLLLEKKNPVSGRLPVPCLRQDPGHPRGEPVRRQSQQVLGRRLVPLDAVDHATERVRACMDPAVVLR